MDTSKELLDTVNEKGEIIGQATREECHSNPKLIHQVVHCWIFNKKGQILWQQRSLNKDSSPGCWDTSCGGHVRAGENPNNVIKREIEEELGLKNVNTNFVEKYLRINPERKQTELIYLYYAVANFPENKFKFSDGEVEQVKWFDIADAQSKYLKNEIKATDFIITQLPKILQFIFAKSVK